MFFTAIGIGVFVYGVVFSVLACLADCDVELWLYEKLGKSPRKYYIYKYIWLVLMEV